MKNTIWIILFAFFSAFATSAFAQEAETDTRETTEIEEEKEKKIIIDENGIRVNITFDDDEEEDLEDLDEKIEMIIEEVEEAMEEIGEEYEDELEAKMEEYEDELEEKFDREYDDDDDCDSKKEDRFRVFLLDWGISSYMYNQSLNLPSELSAYNLQYIGSNHLNLHIFRHRLRAGSGPFAFDYGASINWRNYKFQNDFRFDTESSDVQLIFDGVDYNRNKLRATYFEIPATITYNPLDSKFTISAGGYASMLINSSQRLRSADFGTEKIKDDFNLRSFSYGLVGRVGFGPVEFYAQYSLDPMFNDDLDPDLHQVTFGIALLSF